MIIIADDYHSYYSISMERTVSSLFDNGSPITLLKRFAECRNSFNWHQGCIRAGCGGINFSSDEMTQHSERTFARTDVQEAL
jgi:hypothetical protein